MGLIGLCTQAGVERAPGIGDWEEGEKGGTLGRKASFDFIVIKSANEKVEKITNKLTNKRREKGREKGGLKTSRRKEESEKKKMSTKFAAWRSVLVKQFDHDSYVRLS